MLNEANFVAIFTPVLVYTISDEAGSLEKLLQKFTEENVNIEYMYAFAGKKKAYMIFKVSDPKASEIKLVARGLRSLTQEELDEV